MMLAVVPSYDTALFGKQHFRIPLRTLTPSLPSLQLAVSDSKLGNAIKDKLSIKCVNDSGVMEVMRGIRGQLDSLLSSVGDDNLRAMRLGLSHSLSRYKLKFSADKVGVTYIYVYILS